MPAAQPEELHDHAESPAHELIEKIIFDKEASSKLKIIARLFKNKKRGDKNRKSTTEAEKL